MRLLAHRSAGTIIVATLSCLATNAVDAAPLTIAGGDTILWAYRSLETPQDDAGRLRFAYSLATPGAVRLLPLPMHPAGGIVAQSTVRGPNLHIFFEDGTHYRLRPPPRRRRADRSGKNDFPERKLPDARLPLALCGDDKADVLFAIVHSKTADKLAPPPATQPASQPADTEEAAAGSSPPAAAAARYALVRYAKARWTEVCPMPTLLDEQSFCRLAAYGGTCHLFFARTGASGELLYCQRKGSSWSPPRSIPGVAPDDVLGAFANAKTASLVVRDTSAADEAFTICTVTLLDGDWQRNAALELDNGALRARADGIAVSRFRDSLAIATVDRPEDAGVVRLGLWPLEGGAPTMAPDEVTVLTAKPEPIVNEQTRTLLVTVALTLMLMVAFLRRRESFLADLPTPPGFVLAGHGRRLAAFAIDSALVSMMAVPAMVLPWAAGNDVTVGENMWREMEYAVDRDPEGLFWRWMVAAGLYVLYSIIFEAAMAATPGKLLMQLRVCNSRGQPGSLGAIMVRNLLRFELYPFLQLVPTAILVALTRNRQRLGDLIANTIVVEKAKEE